MELYRRMKRVGVPDDTDGKHEHEWETTRTRFIWDGCERFFAPRERRVDLIENGFLMRSRLALDFQMRLWHCTCNGLLTGGQHQNCSSDSEFRR